MTKKNTEKEEAQKLSLDELLTFTFADADDLYQQVKEAITRDDIDPRIQVDINSPIICPEIVVIVKKDDPAYEDAKDFLIEVQEKPYKGQCILNLYDVTEVFGESSRIFSNICLAQHLLNVWAEKQLLKYIKQDLVGYVARILDEAYIEANKIAMKKLKMK